MKIALVYGTKHGTTQKIAGYIAQNIQNHEIILFNLADHPPIDIAIFDTVIVGGSIHAGGLNRQVKAFLKRNTVALLQKPLALYMCGMNEPELENEFTEGFPALLRNHAISKRLAGGELIFEKMNLIERWMTKRITGIEVTTSKINYEAVDHLIADVNQLSPGISLPNSNTRDSRTVFPFSPDLNSSRDTAKVVLPKNKLHE